MAEFEEGAILLQNHNSKAEMEFINSQLIRKDGDDHAYDHNNNSAFSSHLHMIPPVSYTDDQIQMSLFQSDHHHHELSAASEPTVHTLLGFGGGDFTTHGSKKGKSSLPMSSEQLFNFASHETGFNKMELGGGKKRKRNSNGVEKPKEVVHVRAKRGQATDSHSLAERVRREKINERLRCLQGLVPGCYKTMGMAVMFDVISNYVRSLQNQVEFLSMKLSAASMYNELNFLDMAIDTNTMPPSENQGADA